MAHPQRDHVFSFGTDVIDIEIQMSILRSVTDKDPNLDPAAAIKRASLWKGWYLRTPNDSRQFLLQHLPAIACEYAHTWGLAELIADDDAIPPRLLQQIGDQIRSLLHYSNTTPVARLRNGDAVRVPLDESSTTMNNKERIKLTTRFGVPRHSIELGDPFHINNLIVTLASLAAFGETERNNHRQTHHRQLIQSIHDIHKKAKKLSQKVMDQVLEGTGCVIRIHTTRERQQRWLVNSRSCERILHAMTTKMMDGMPALLV
jgi:hypothetical protein